MSAIINSRSPFYIRYDVSAVNPNPAIRVGNVILSIRIWAGHLVNDKPTEATYQLRRDAAQTGTAPATNYPICEDHIAIEVSELIRDFIYTEYFNNAQDAVWVSVEGVVNRNSNDSYTTDDTYLAFDGFGYFPEGANPRTSTDPTQSSFTPQVLQTNTCVYFMKDKDIRIPMFSEPESIISTGGLAGGKWNEVAYYWETATINWDDTGTQQQILDSNDSADKIQYLVIDGGDYNNGDTITITSTQGNSQVTTITLIEVECSKYDPIRAVFYNKFGALQDIYLNLKSQTRLRTKDNSYNSNVMDFSTGVEYDIYQHTKKRFDVTAKEQITANTGYVGECLNDPIKQLLMSEQVWLEFDDLSVTPVVITTSSMREKTHVNEKLIQYTLEFEYAYDKIQNIR